MGRMLIIGFGNLLMGDDGAGVHLIQKLTNQALPPQVELLDGGVCSFAALGELQSASMAILVDSMTGGGKPGDIYRLTADQLGCGPPTKALSVHDFSLLDSLRVAQQTGTLPPVIIYGIEPACLDLSLELSPLVELAVDTVITRIMADIGSTVRQ